MPDAPLPDTVATAQSTPDTPQPYAELGMAEDEYARVRQILGRRPTSAELAIYSVMWSEHCSYKSSKKHLRQFGEKAPASDALLVGMGENAGVVDVGGGRAVTFKIESHNHPSYVEPHQGAATGVGGIVRDILTMGARPVAVMDALRFGPLDAPDTRRVLPGVVSGISFYGNCLGLPNIGGEIGFGAGYAGNPLVNALCVGVMRHEDIKLAQAPGPGNKVVLFGATTGPDGIGGASVLASATFDDESHAKRPSVQVGDPFMEKLLIECSLELFAADLVVGIQDLGAAGVSCATTELAAGGTGGMRIELDRVPLRDPRLTPEEILMSESQERMMAIVEPAKLDAFLATCRKWNILAGVIGEVTDVTPEEAERGGRLVMTWHGETVVDMPPRTASDEGPVYDRPYARPADQDGLQADTPDRLERPKTDDDLREQLLRVLAAPGVCDSSWVTQQYDRYVMGNTVLATPHDGGMIRVADDTDTGIALATDGNGRYTRLDPYTGTQAAYAEAYRNVAATGARPLAVTNCLNFGSPEDPGVMWQFAESTRGLADACQALGTPVTGGNVSFYNQTGDTAINPTPVIGVLGVIDDVHNRLTSALPADSDGARIVLLGRTAEEFGGSVWAEVVHGHLGGLPPAVDLAAEAALGELLADAAEAGLLAAAHDLSDGGLGVAVAESALRGGVGATLHVTDAFTALFSESGARAVVVVRPEQEAAFAALCERHGVPAAEIGTVGGSALTVTHPEGGFSVSLEDLRTAYESTLPAVLGAE
ncbi:phosphoribosylformylglycinamidine synthase subunit PurL [Streptomonospora nanhaiensis]|uniref:Phosphoribosylformylglycinamidine synthase subunit PurL n=1 Tax=Streptomonospora nanhaiensis TaxID=1323731 RepID=A0A853BM84_9ACTN|nr:phosphoribosylformylglycinamidine synthase subunit PurL [Streptomonospora nanhaiensis]MBX9391847.1 phosphoribosylformylglycinamidine synthase subunit PurL [Streptomonospora nanhaiensis]NYI96689.1 phosphoribosylformylglycinamidine synthase [Streptomonospora nanhaiensis]